MTRQLQQLEAAGWVSRVANPHDARSMLVQLTPGGLALIDRAVTAHVDNLARLVAPLAPAQYAELEAQLAALLALLEPPVA
jgi:DNA-binding MarR family transcriptional regulator